MRLGTPAGTSVPSRCSAKARHDGGGAGLLSVGWAEKQLAFVYPHSCPVVGQVLGLKPAGGASPGTRSGGRGVSAGSMSLLLEENLRPRWKKTFPYASRHGATGVTARQILSSFGMETSGCAMGRPIAAAHAVTFKPNSLKDPQVVPGLGCDANPAVPGSHRLQICAEKRTWLGSREEGDLGPALSSSGPRAVGDGGCQSSRASGSP